MTVQLLDRGYPSTPGEAGHKRNPVKRNILLVILASLSLLFFIREGHAEEIKDYRWVWCFYERESALRYETKVFRPFYMKNEYRRDRSIFDASLMPLVFWRYRNSRKSEWKSLFGLVDSMDYRHSNGVQDYDFGAFPLLYYGDSQDARDRYFLLWPVGGTVRGKLGQDRISAYVFPGVLLFFKYPPKFPPNWLTIGILVLSLIPVYADYQHKEYQAWAVFWPLIQRGRSPDRDDFRVLPFYAHNYKRNSYDNYSWLLLINYEHNYFKDDQSKTVFVLPFYGRRWSRSGKMASSTLLWPFFSWGYNKKSADYELNFPWPLMQIRDCASPPVYKMIFFPFYGWYIYDTNETFFVTPFYFNLRKKTASLESDYYFHFIIIWYFKRDYKKTHPVYGKSWRYFKIWPLYQYEKDDRGNLAYSLLSLLPFRDPEGYERLYQPFWTLFEYRRFQDGEQRLGLILRFYYQRWNENFFYSKFFPFYSYGHEGGKLRDFTVLLSMLGYEYEKKGRYLRLLWIPLRLGDSDPGDFPEEAGSKKGDKRADSEALQLPPSPPPAPTWEEPEYRGRAGCFVLQQGRVF